MVVLMSEGTLLAKTMLSMPHTHMYICAFVVKR